MPQVVKTSVESARDEALMERPESRGQSRAFASWTGEQHDVPARGLLSRAMGVASRSRTAFPPAEVSLQGAALPVSS